MARAEIADRRQGMPGMKTRILGLATGLALAVAANAPAQAQFMSGSYPIIVVPPPAQNMVLPTAEAGSAAETRRSAARRVAAGPDPVPLSGADEGLRVSSGFARRLRRQRIGGAYWMPPLFQSSFRPRGMPSFVWTPTLRSKISP